MRLLNMRQPLRIASLWLIAKLIDIIIHDFDISVDL